MQKRELKVGELLQLHPEHPKFPGQIVCCTEPREWGCQGVLWTEFDLGDSVCRYKGRAFVRPKFEDIEPVGFIEWLWKDDEEEEDAKATCDSSDSC